MYLRDILRLPAIPTEGLHSPFFVSLLDPPERLRFDADQYTTPSTGTGPTEEERFGKMASGGGAADRVVAKINEGRPPTERSAPKWE